MFSTKHFKQRALSFSYTTHSEPESRSAGTNIDEEGKKYQLEVSVGDIWWIS